MAEAERFCRDALRDDPSHFDALYLLGLLRLMHSDFAEAENFLVRAAQIAPYAPEIPYHLAIIRSKSGRKAEALAAYDRAIALRPDYPEAHINRGNILQEMGRFDEALASFSTALAAKPDSPVALYNRARVLYRVGRLDQALADYARAIALNPDFADAYHNRGVIFRERGAFEAARADSEKALALQPELGLAASTNFLLTSLLCDWRGRGTMLADLAQRGAAGQKMETFTLLCAFDDPVLHLRAARIAAGPPAEPLARHPSPGHDRLRIAYLSADFCDHPVAYQAVHLFECHDRSCFETYGICTNPVPAPSAIRTRLQGAFSQFIEAGGDCDLDLAKRLAAHHIDIAVELGGHTGRERMTCLSFRPAPIAVSYLGYPGTLGAEYVDYIIADEQVIPPGCEAHYSEKVVRLPDCFMPSDMKVRQRTAMPSRRVAGLPE
jgi:predicted O-linked N-acetylglucosamine transferase (SPINDLY family)